jgi:hypothetical protein
MSHTAARLPVWVRSARVRYTVLPLTAAGMSIDPVYMPEMAVNVVPFNPLVGAAPASVTPPPVYQGVCCTAAASAVTAAFPHAYG